MYHDVDGIVYQVSGRHASVLEVFHKALLCYLVTHFLQLQHKIERNEDEFEFNSATDDVYAVSSLLKVRCQLLLVQYRMSDILPRSCIYENYQSQCSSFHFKIVFNTRRNEASFLSVVQ